MKRFGAFFVFIYATICCIYGVTIRHMAEFSTDKLELNIQEFGDTTATVITWSDMSPVGNPGEYALPSTFVSFAVPRDCQLRMCVW